VDDGASRDGKSVEGADPGSMRPDPSHGHPFGLTSVYILGQAARIGTSGPGGNSSPR
jgi:hypothetical protein